MKIINIKINRRGIQILEYTTITMLVVVGIMVIGRYIERSWNAHTKSLETSVQVSQQDRLDSTNDGITIGECVCHLQHPCVNPLPGGECCGFGTCGPTQDSMINICNIQGCGAIGSQCTDNANCCYDAQIVAPPQFCGANAVGQTAPVGSGPCEGQTVNFPVPDGQQVVCHICGDPNPANPTHVLGSLSTIYNPACVFQCGAATQGGAIVQTYPPSFPPGPGIYQTCPSDTLGLVNNTPITARSTAQGCSSPAGSPPKCEVLCTGTNFQPDPAIPSQCNCVPGYYLQVTGQTSNCDESLYCDDHIYTPSETCDTPPTYNGTVNVAGGSIQPWPQPSGGVNGVCVDQNSTTVQCSGPGCKEAGCNAILFTTWMRDFGAMEYDTTASGNAFLARSLFPGSGSGAADESWIDYQCLNGRVAKVFNHTNFPYIPPSPPQYPSAQGCQNPLLPEPTFCSYCETGGSPICGSLYESRNTPAGWNSIGLIPTGEDWYLNRTISYYGPALTNQEPSYYYSGEGTAFCRLGCPAISGSNNDSRYTIACTTPSNIPIYSMPAACGGGLSTYPDCYTIKTCKDTLGNYHYRACDNSCPGNPNGSGALNAAAHCILTATPPGNVAYAGSISPLVDAAHNVKVFLGAPGCLDRLTTDSGSTGSCNTAKACDDSGTLKPFMCDQGISTSGIAHHPNCPTNNPPNGTTCPVGGPVGYMHTLTYAGGTSVYTLHYDCNDSGVNFASYEPILSVSPTCQSSRCPTLPFQSQYKNCLGTCVNSASPFTCNNTLTGKLDP